MADRFRQRSSLLLRCLRPPVGSRRPRAFEAEALRLDSTDEMMEGACRTPPRRRRPRTNRREPASSAPKDRNERLGSAPRLLARPARGDGPQGPRAESLAAVRHAVALNKGFANASPSSPRALATTLWKLDHL